MITMDVHDAVHDAVHPLTLHVRARVPTAQLLRGEEGQRWVRLAAVAVDAGYTPLFEFGSPALSESHSRPYRSCDGTGSARSPRPPGVPPTAPPRFPFGCRVCHA